MNILEKANRIIKKVAVVLFIIIVFETVDAKLVHADATEDNVEFGGKLAGPIMSLIVSLGD